MITLSTPIIPRPLTKPITHEAKILSFGSCFAEHIAAKLNDYRFNLCTNPTGILYNPAAIQLILNRLMEGREFATEDLFLHNELWCSFSHHGRFSHPDRQTALMQMNTEFDKAVSLIQDTHVLLLTFGTAFAWYPKDQPGHAVANCHKLPTTDFVRRMIPAHDTALQLSPIIQELKTRNPELQVILTVSPVRHMRQSASENSLSKAQLITACHLLSAEQDFIHYFPAYEIMLDELRDYRFYANDLIHPNELAQQIIWERFSESCLSELSRQFIADYTPILQMQNHRPIHPGTNHATTFQQSLKNKIAVLQKKYPETSIQE